jgi:CO dehydrogenase maturation factor
MGEGSTSRPVILFCGKGGVGKTTFSAMTIQLLCRKKDLRVLAIDADPAMGLALTLGIRPNRTIDDILSDRETLKGGRDAVYAALDYELAACLKESDNLSFLALGRPESEGCFCAVNQVLKQVIERFCLAFDAVLIDAEAGVEQINRRVFDAVTHLFVVSDPTRKGLLVAETILGLASRSIHFTYCCALINRVQTGTEISADLIAGFDRSFYVPEDPAVRAFDLHGGDPLILPGTYACERLALSLKDLKLI